MRRLVSALAAGTLALGLLGLSPTSASADGCDDPDHPFTAAPLDTTDLAVDVAGTQALRFAIDGPAGCATDAAYVRITTPRQQLVVHLDEADDGGPGRFARTGVYAVDPVLLRNPDAGTWHATYEVDGQVYAAATLQVRRATRLTFGAGPVRHHKVTFSGRLERADWEWRAYRAYGRKRVVVSALGTDGHLTSVARAKTTKHGKYHVRKRFPGPGGYQAGYAGNATSAPTTSPVVTVGRVR